MSEGPNHAILKRLAVPVFLPVFSSQLFPSPLIAAEPVLKATRAQKVSEGVTVKGNTVTLKPASGVKS